MIPLQYYFVKNRNLELVIFNKYYIENDKILNKKTGKTLEYFTNKAGYNYCNVSDDHGKRHTVLIGRVFASSLKGPPPTSSHTVDHIDQNRRNDTNDNIRWLGKTGQNKNRTFPKSLKSAFIVVKDGVEKTVNDWLYHFKDDMNTFGRYYTKNMIKDYAQREQFGFAYKKFPNLPGEVWKEVIGSKNTQGGRWEISDMNRVKYITTYAENVLSDYQLETNGYPTITINGVRWLCHILSFKTFFPDEYDAKKPGEIVLHENDDKMNFRPHKLRLGTQCENRTEAHDNGKYDGTKTERKRCVSYINDVLEKEYGSQHDAVKYLKTIGYAKAACANISKALIEFRKGNIIMCYDRIWKIV